MTNKNSIEDYINYIDPVEGYDDDEIYFSDVYEKQRYQITFKEWLGDIE